MLHVLVSLCLCDLWLCEDEVSEKQLETSKLEESNRLKKGIRGGEFIGKVLAKENGNMCEMFEKTIWC